MLKKMFLTLAVLFCFASTSLAAEFAAIKLPPPDMKGGKPLMQCLKDRKTDRSFSTKKLPVEVLSNLLWAAAGISRPDGRRTAPSAKNWQEVNVYVAMAEGLYLYNAKTHSLDPVLKADLRKETTHFLQPSRSDIEAAPLQLIYVADYSKMTIATSDENKLLYSGADSAFIAQNVYLYCASEGLATGIRALLDKTGLAKDMKLRSQQKVVFVQAVGYPE
ncbi:MAG: nitroreductase [Deltaproteobacteria bacterium HGW-Deltaproteobacteria-6]|nr:MAG: nitroreductase [Deltaproteobacteria bacterium HGW-Deltaproteobacteria-6]